MRPRLEGKRVKLYKILYDPLESTPYDSRPRFMRRAILPVMLLAAVLIIIIIAAV
jgi:hypothetical protein